MHRNDWPSAFINQDRILESLKNLENEILLAGGTGLHRHALRIPYRHSEDLDFFFPELVSKERLDEVAHKLMELMKLNTNATLESKKREKEELTWRFWYKFNDNEEIIKVELLNFTCCRLEDTGYLKEDIFRTENLYNLLLYKFKALCDRPDTIKDLFDIYFIMRELPSLSIENVFKDINTKFSCAMSNDYQPNHVISALGGNLTWDIEIGDNIKYVDGMKLEVEEFRIALRVALENNNVLDFSYKSRIMQYAKDLDLSKEDYIELIKFVVDNTFLEEEFKNFRDR